VPSMFVFGIAYAIASLGCTIGPFLGTVLGAVSTQGIATGAITIAVYGVGMALVVTALTVTLALANTTLLRLLRKGMEWFEYVAGVFVLLTGVYLSYYWYKDIREQYDSDVVSGVQSWQTELSTFIQDHQTPIVIIASSVIAVAIAFTVWNKQRHDRVI